MLVGPVTEKGSATTVTEPLSACSVVISVVACQLDDPPKADEVHDDARVGHFHLGRGRKVLDTE